MTNRLTPTLLDIAAEVEADETRLKREVLDAACAGDGDTAGPIVVQRLIRFPPNAESRVLPYLCKHLLTTPCLPQPSALESSPPGRETRLEAC